VQWLGGVTQIKKEAKIKRTDKKDETNGPDIGDSQWYDQPASHPELPKPFILLMIFCAVVCSAQ
jgi:hypothetical protein